ncbi:MAG TPA: hypothetical protein VEP30_11055 [Chthoniobacterales bacterium]|nr:hypothetical protein [Chthoniobacterales bacterium]
MNPLTVSVAPGAADRLLRTDTFYGGWRARLNGQPIRLEHGASPFSTINLPASETAAIFMYTYRPTCLAGLVALSIVTGSFIVGSKVLKRITRRQT